MEDRLLIGAFSHGRPPDPKHPPTIAGPPLRPRLQILSQSKNPLAVQPHLRKCFEAIESLDFAPDLTISAMTSREGERVAFDKLGFGAGNRQGGREGLGGGCAGPQLPGPLG
jgi:hypothetical protein